MDVVLGTLYNGVESGDDPLVAGQLVESRLLIFYQKHGDDHVLDTTVLRAGDNFSAGIPARYKLSRLIETILADTA